MLHTFLSNHVLANVTFIVVLVMGTLTYIQLPREQDPAINFNWINITTVLPGASASDMEKQVTDILEDAVRKVSDIRFVSSVSRTSVSSILVRFQELDERVFDKRVNDLRREIQNKERELPAAAETPQILEITSANAFPVAFLAVVGQAEDENLRWQAEQIRQDLERMTGVESVNALALPKPELHVNLNPQALETFGIAPVAVADTVTAHYRDVAAGTVDVGQQRWLIRFSGAVSDPEYLAHLPVLAAPGEVLLKQVGTVERGRQKAETHVRFTGQPAVLFGINKKSNTNLLELVARINAYSAERNRLTDNTGVHLVVVNDQTDITRNALAVMQNNAVVGLLLVTIVTWAFLGSRIAFFTCIGIPFILAGTFWILNILNQTLNVSVLLGVVIALGMLVDDAVVIVEAIFYRMQRGAEALTASLAALHEVFAPVTTSVLTTIAAFLPLMLLPGILGQFMRVIPLVVTVALTISLIEAFWMLPAHVMAARINFNQPSRIHRYRLALLRSIRHYYTLSLIWTMRHPWITLLGAMLLMGSALGAVIMQQVRVDFFASDPLRIFYINVEMPVGTPLAQTLAKTLEIEQQIRPHLREGEVRGMVSYAGQAFTETAPVLGDQYGQISLSLYPKTAELRDVDEMIAALRPVVERIAGTQRVWFLRLAGGPPIGKPINVKVRGNDFLEIRAAVTQLKALIATKPEIRDVTDDDSEGLMELLLRLNHDAVRRAGLAPQEVIRTINLLAEGEIAARLQDRGEEVEVRVRLQPTSQPAIDDFLRLPIPLPQGGQIPLSELVIAIKQKGQGQIRHYNFRRTITIEADIDKTVLDTVTANRWIMDQWATVAANYPNVNLDFSGEFDDIQETLDAIGFLFLFGIGLIYLILGTQFKSYFQPLLILMTVPMAFTGVVYGLWVTNNPLSLFTLYGVVALAGVAVNAAIVLISAANDRRRNGMSVTTATLYAARRRVIPILITSATTVAGLASLATGFAGESLLWGPVATAIVWGLTISTILTLFLMPLLYRLFNRCFERRSV